MAAGEFDFDKLMAEAEAELDIQDSFSVKRELSGVENYGGTTTPLISSGSSSLPKIGDGQSPPKPPPAPVSVTRMATKHMMHIDRSALKKSERQQLHAFKGWFNAHLFKRGLKIDSLMDGISSVVPLIHLLEILSNGKIPGIVKQHKKPRHRFDRMAALHLCIEFINKRSRKRVDISYDKEKLLTGKDVKLSLALAWRIINTFIIAEQVQNVGLGDGSAAGSASQTGSAVGGSAAAAGRGGGGGSGAAGAGGGSGSAGSYTGPIDFGDVKMAPSVDIGAAATYAGGTVALSPDAMVPPTPMTVDTSTGLINWVNNALHTHGAVKISGDEVAASLAPSDDRLAYGATIEMDVAKMDAGALMAGGVTISPIHNLTSDFLDGNVLAELLNLATLDDKDKIIPGELARQASLSMTDVDPKVAFLTHIFKHGEEYCDMPQMIIVEDFVENPDAKSMVAYLSLLKDKVAEVQTEKNRMARMDSLSSTAAASAAVMETVAKEESFDPTKVTPMEVARMKEDLDFLESKTATVEMELEMTKGALSKERDDLLEERKGFEEERIRMQREVEETKTSAADLQRERDELSSELTQLKEEMSAMEKRVDSMGAGSTPGSMTMETEEFYKSKIKSLQTFIEDQKTKFSAAYQEQKERLTRSNQAGREYREKSHTAQREVGQLTATLADTQNELAIKEGRVEQLEERVGQLKNDIASQEVMFKMQIKELGQFIKDMKRKSKMREKMDLKYMKERDDYEVRLRDYYISLGAKIPKVRDPSRPELPWYPTEKAIGEVLAAKKKRREEKARMKAAAPAAAAPAAAAAAHSSEVDEKKQDDPSAVHKPADFSFGDIPRLPTGDAFDSVDHAKQDPYAAPAAFSSEDLRTDAAVSSPPKSQEESDAEMAARLQAQFEAEEREAAERRRAAKAAEVVPTVKASSKVIAEQERAFAQARLTAGGPPSGGVSAAMGAVESVSKMHIDLVESDDEDSDDVYGEDGLVQAEKDFEEQSAASVAGIKFEISDAARQLMEENGVRGFHKMDDLKKTRMGGDKVRIIWNYIGSDGNIHVIGLKHFYSAAQVRKGGMTKRSLRVDGKEVSADKNEVQSMEFRVERDQLVIQIVPDVVKGDKFNHLLLINGRRHDDLMLAFYSSYRAR